MSGKHYTEKMPSIEQSSKSVAESVFSSIILNQLLTPRGKILLYHITPPVTLKDETIFSRM